MTYVIYPESITVGFNDNQWSSYNQYENWNRKGIAEFKKIIINSKEHEYAGPVEVMSLGVRCGIKGVGTRKPKEMS